MIGRLGVLLALLLFSTTAVCAENISIYTLHVGVNDPPKGSSLPRLKFADDDAVRMFRFMQAFSQKSIPAVVLDTDSQKRHPDIGKNCIAPTTADLKRALDEIASLMRRDRAQGRKVVFYFTYSGHGERTDDGARLLLLDGFIDRHGLEELILKMPSDVIHLIIDACYAEGIIDSKGIVRSATDATARDIAESEMDTLTRGGLLDGYPSVGALVSASSNEESYEWSQLGSGVFTHELLSAFSGAADVNGDGEIAYSEVASFMSAANRSVVNEKAAPRVISHPPSINRNLPILSFHWAPKLSFLQVKSIPEGQFTVETASGQRLLDAHLEPKMSVKLTLPADELLWIRTADKSAAFVVPSGGTVEGSSLQFRENDAAPRGSMETAFQKGLFATRFGPDYYIGWIAGSGEVGVLFSSDDGSAVDIHLGPTPLKVKFAIVRQSPLVLTVERNRAVAAPAALFAFGGALAVSGGVFLGLSLHAERDFDNTDLERPAALAADRCRLYTGLSIGLGALSMVPFIVGAVLKKRLERKMQRTLSFP